MMSGLRRVGWHVLRCRQVGKAVDDADEVSGSIMVATADTYIGSCCNMTMGDEASHKSFALSASMSFLPSPSKSGSETGQLSPMARGRWSWPPRSRLPHAIYGAGGAYERLSRCHLKSTCLPSSVVPDSSSSHQTVPNEEKPEATFPFGRPCERPARPCGPGGEGAPCLSHRQSKTE